MAYTKVNREHGYADDLDAADVPYLLPLYRYRRRDTSGKWVTTDKPLFPGYLFIAGNEYDYINATLAGRVRRRLSTVIPVSLADTPRLLADLCALMNAIDSGLPLGKAEPLRPGVRVRVVSGFYAGTIGTLVREVSGRESLQIAVRLIGLGTLLEVESWRCEAVAEGEDTP